MDRKRLRWLISLVAIFGVFCTFSPALADIVLPVINEANADNTNSLLYISGQNFGTNHYSVLLGNTTLTIKSWSAYQIVANLPTNITPGSYLLTVYTGKVLPFAVMAVTIGGQGPQGLPGPKGDKGDQGFQGAKG